MQHSESISQIGAALAQAHSAIINPPLDKTNPHFGSKFASLGAHLNAVRKPLADNGISVVQSVSSGEGAVILTTTLLHKSGEWLQDAVSMPVPEKATAQAVGSLLTYLRRYSLAAMTGIVGEDDDDGNADRDAGDRAPVKPVGAKRAPANGGNWPKSGVTVCTFSKTQKRGENWAVYAQSEFGEAWLKASDELGKAIESKSTSYRWEVDFTKVSPEVIQIDALRPEGGAA